MLKPIRNLLGFVYWLYASHTFFFIIIIIINTLSESFCFQAFWIVAQVQGLLCYT